MDTIEKYYISFLKLQRFRSMLISQAIALCFWEFAFSGVEAFNNSLKINLNIFNTTENYHDKVHYHV